MVQGRDFSGGVHFHTTDRMPPANPVVPRQLPGDVRGFVSREAELERLDALLEGAGGGGGRLCVIAGTAGVGKTSLAVHWAHRARAHFPDGQLHINLRGYDPATPITPAQALERFLQALGMPPAAIPADEDARAAAYRTLLADKHILIVLDNAATASQVRPLLPGTDTCLTLVTSRSRLSGLITRDGAQRLTLDVLDEPAAIELLKTTTAGHRTDHDQDIAELARLCARLPLALRVAGERAAARPRTPLHTLIDDLRDQSS
ncbi:AAA family ATPase, partial [Streptomyces sp. URMC 129]|uniref:AAA family ATPase n=1 Tax=Streptomyces sp. URMC 129 TaxID=3423407 RepID=UPI003F1D916E